MENFRAKRKEYILVDGYNIIHAWKELQTLALGSLDDARCKLIDMLSDFGGSQGVDIIIVFDAHMVKENTETVEKHHNITVVYTKEGETADHYIEKFVRSLAKEGRVRVATSDHLQQAIVMGRGAYRIGAQEFLCEVRLAKNKLRDQYINNKPIKKNLLIDNLDPQTAEILEKMRHDPRL